MFVVGIGIDIGSLTPKAIILDDEARVVGQALALSRPINTSRGAPDSGDGNGSVYGIPLGMSQGEIERPARKGTIGITPVPEVRARIPKALQRTQRRT